MRRTKPLVKPLSESQLRAEVERLLRTKEMPSFTELCAAITETKAKYAPRLRRAKREYRDKISVN